MDVSPPSTCPLEDIWLFMVGAPVVDGITASDYQDADGRFHFNFNLKDSGEFLAIVRPDGRTLESVIEPQLPCSVR